MEETRSSQIARVREFCARQPAAVLFDEPGEALLDVPSGKRLPLPLAALRQVEERTDTQTGQSYLWLELDDGRQLALSTAGIAFPPLIANTGALPELPQAVCWNDYAILSGKLRHQLYGHPDQPPDRGAARLVLMCIAMLEGARAAGFEMGREEQELETDLRELEKRPGATAPRGR